MRRRGQSRRGERGGISIMLLLLILTFSTFAIGLMVVGRVMLRRQALQHGTDAMALQGAWWMLKGEGMPTTPGLPAGQGDMIADVNAVNGAAMTGPAFTFPPGLRMALTTSDGAMQMQAPRSSMFDTGNVNARALAKLRQQLFTKDQLVYRRAKVALVLDYSGSMKRPISLADASPAITSLRGAVNLFLDKAREVDVAGVLYDTNVFANAVYSSWNTTGPSSNDYSAIRTLIDRQPQGDTATGEGIGAGLARVMEGENFGRYILLVSDGEPCCNPPQPDPFGQARAAARGAWASDTTVYSIEIQRSDSTGDFHQLLLDTSANAGDTTPRAANHFHADNAAALSALFESISSTFMCHVVLDTAPIQPNFMGAFLRTAAGVEERIPRYCANGLEQAGECPEGPQALACVTAGTPQCLLDSQGKPAFRGFRYEATTRRVIFPNRVCVDIIGGRNVVVRFDRPFL